MANDFVDFIEANIWAPIVAGVALLVILGVVFYFFCLRKRTRDGYASLEGQAVDVYIDREAKLRVSAEREAASLTCQFYLRSTPQYALLQQLGDIGSRVQKYCFVIRMAGHDDQLLSLQPLSKECCIPPTKSVLKAVKNVVSLCIHPYVAPLTDVEVIADQNKLVFVHPLYVRGSLKDLIHNSNPIQEWALKYRSPGKPLPLKKIAQFGRQILEGALYLRQKEVPYGHLHTGNVMIHNGNCLISGYENAIFGYKSKLHVLLKGMLKHDKEAVDVLSFGHVLYEMAMGYELAVSKPDVSHLVGRCPPEVVEVLAFIFHNAENRFPTLNEVVAMRFFAGAPVPELDVFHPPLVPVTSQMRELLRSVKAGQMMQTKTKKKVAETSLGGGPASVNSSYMPSDASPAGAASGGGGAAAAVASPLYSSPAAASTPLPQGSRRGSVAPVAPVAAAAPPMGGRSMSSASFASDVSAPVSPSPSVTSDRSALLSQIQGGAALKKTVTNDRSAPKV